VPDLASLALGDLLHRITPRHAELDVRNVADSERSLALTDWVAGWVEVQL